MLLLPDFLAFDAVFEVKSSERSDRDAFLSELSMEQFGSKLERFACPLLESGRVSQVLDVFFA